MFKTAETSDSIACPDRECVDPQKTNLTQDNAKNLPVVAAVGSGTLICCS